MALKARAMSATTTMTSTNVNPVLFFIQIIRSVYGDGAVVGDVTAFEYTNILYIACLPFELAIDSSLVSVYVYPPIGCVSPVSNWIVSKDSPLIGSSPPLEKYRSNSPAVL
jgi:hypothetical protein